MIAIIQEVHKKTFLNANQWARNEELS